MLPLGLSVGLTGLRFRNGGSVTWAAKTECERIPKPRKNSQEPASPLRRLFTIYLDSYALFTEVVPAFFSAHSDWTLHTFIR